MQQDGAEPEILAVAGCLFEVSMPERDGASWGWAGGQPEVTFLGESVRGRRRHFRFRAEEAAATAGQVSIRFRSDTAERGMSMRAVVVLVAPEQGPAG